MSTSSYYVANPKLCTQTHISAELPKLTLDYMISINYLKQYLALAITLMNIDGGKISSKAGMHASHESP